MDSTASLPYGETELPLESVDCYMCSSTDGQCLVDEPPFKVIRCRQCSFVYVTPRVPDSHLHLIYQTEYFNSPDAGDFGYSDYTRDREGYIRTFQKKARIVQRFKKGGRVLEIGSAAGFFLHAMNEAGFESDGIEVSEFAANFARTELGMKSVFNGMLHEAPFERGRYDVLALWDVIEHLADPGAELIRMREFLKPDGILVMQTQNVESHFAKLLGAKWQHYKHLEHVYHFSPKTMKDLLAKAGFEIVDVTSRGAGKFISVDFFVDRMRRYSKVLNVLLKPAQALFGRRFFYINPGDEIIVVARKSEPAEG